MRPAGATAHGWKQGAGGHSQCSQACTCTACVVSHQASRCAKCRPPPLHAHTRTVQRLPTSAFSRPRAISMRRMRARRGVRKRLLPPPGVCAASAACRACAPAARSAATSACRCSAAGSGIPKCRAHTRCSWPWPWAGGTSLTELLLLLPSSLLLSSGLLLMLLARRPIRMRACASVPGPVSPRPCPCPALLPATCRWPCRCLPGPPPPLLPAARLLG